MIGAPDVRVSVFSPLGTLILADVSADFAGGQIMYEQTPAGSGAATFTLGLRYEEAFARGYWTARNIIEVSSGDDTLQTAISSAATKLYVTGTAAYDTSVGQDTGQIYLWDGSTLTMRIPVTGVGTDGGGSYITVGSPLGGGSIPAYAQGTLIGRRRYCGRITQRPLTNQLLPNTQITCEGMLNRLNEAFGTFTIGSNSSTDCGAAMYGCLQQFFSISRFPELTISGSFPTVGCTYSGASSDTSVLAMCQNILNAISTGDLWELYVGHDRVVKLVRLYTNSSNSYAYNIALPQGVTYFEPVNVLNTDQVTSSQVNSVKVIGATDPSTNQPVNAIEQDATSITDFGQIDAQPVMNYSVKTVAEAQAMAASLLNQYSAPQSNGQFRVYTGPNAAVTQRPMGLDNGDVVLGVHCVTVTRFDATGAVKNLAPDSEIQYPPQTPADLPATLWTVTGSLSRVLAAGPSGSNVWRYVGTGSASGVYFANSQYVDVVPGQVLTISGYINGTNVTSGSPFWGVSNTAGSTRYGYAPQTPGTSGRVSATFTVPSGLYQVLVFCDTNACTVTNGLNLDFAQPQLELAGSASAYVPNYAAPNLFGLVSSAQTTIIPGGYEYQDVYFSAIEPDWGATIAQRANAQQTAIAQDQLQAPGLSQYFVSANAWPSGGPTASGLTVTVPTFQAVFAQGTQPVEVGGNTFTCTANATTWAWITSGNTWTLRNDTTFVSGGILYGIFQAGSSSILGETSKATIGALAQPMSYLLNNAAFTPTFTSLSISQTLTDNLSSQITVLFEVTNQPTDGSFSKCRLWYRQYGQTYWTLFADQAPNNSSGTAQAINGPFSATGLYTFNFPDAANGLEYQFGFSLESSATTETAVVTLGSITPSSNTTPGSGGLTLPGSALPAYNTNLISDSNFQNSPFNSSNIAASSEYWDFVLIDGASYFIGKGNAADGSNYMGWTPGSSGTARYGYNAVPIPVIVGQTYVVSCYMDATTITGSARPFIAIYNYTSGSLGSSLQAIAQTNGTAGRIQIAWTCPSGVTQIVVYISNNSCTVASSILVAATPQFELIPPGQPAVASPYKPTVGVLSNGTQAYGVTATAVALRIDTSSAINVSNTAGGGPGAVNGLLPYANHATAITNRIDGSSGLNISSSPGTIFGLLPYANNSTQITNRVDTSSALNVSNGPGAVTGNLPQANHDPTVLLGSVSGTQNNLVPDSGILFGSGNDGFGHWIDATYWNFSNSTGSHVTNPVIYFNAGSIGSNGFVWFGVGGASSGGLYIYSASMYLPAGTYTLSGFIDATHVTAGSPEWTVTNSGLGGNYGNAVQTPGVVGRVQGTVTIPTSGNYVVLANLNNCTIGNGLGIVFATPQLEAGSLMTSYNQSGAPANIGTWDHTTMSPGTQAAISSTGEVIGIGGVLVAQSTTCSTTFSSESPGYNWTSAFNVNLSLLPSYQTFFIEIFMSVAPDSWSGTNMVITPEVQSGTVSDFGSFPAFSPAPPQFFSPAIASFIAAGNQTIVMQFALSVISGGSWTASGGAEGTIYSIKATRLT